MSNSDNEKNEEADTKSNITFGENIIPGYSATKRYEVDVELNDYSERNTEFRTLNNDDLNKRWIATTVISVLALMSSWYAIYDEKNRNSDNVQISCSSLNNESPAFFHYQDRSLIALASVECLVTNNSEKATSIKSIDLIETGLWSTLETSVPYTEEIIFPLKYVHKIINDDGEESRRLDSNGNSNIYYYVVSSYEAIEDFTISEDCSFLEDTENLTIREIRHCIVHLFFLRKIRQEDRRKKVDRVAYIKIITTGGSEYNSERFSVLFVDGDTL